MEKQIILDYKEFLMLEDKAKKFDLIKQYLVYAMNKMKKHIDLDGIIFSLNEAINNDNYSRIKNVVGEIFSTEQTKI